MLPPHPITPAQVDPFNSHLPKTFEVLAPHLAPFVFNLRSILGRRITLPSPQPSDISPALGTEPSVLYYCSFTHSSITRRLCALLAQNDIDAEPKLTTNRNGREEEVGKIWLLFRLDVENPNPLDTYVLCHITSFLNRLHDTLVRTQGINSKVKLGEYVPPPAEAILCKYDNVNMYTHVKAIAELCRERGYEPTVLTPDLKQPWYLGPGEDSWFDQSSSSTLTSFNNSETSPSLSTRAPINKMPKKSIPTSPSVIARGAAPPTPISPISKHKKTTTNKENQRSKQVIKEEDINNAIPRSTKTKTKSSKNEKSSSKNKNQTPVQSADDDEDDNDDNDDNDDPNKKYVVEDIIDMQLKKEEGRRGKPYYHVKWQGYSAKWNTWEPHDNLVQDIPDDVKRYLQRHRPDLVSKYFRD
jgi:hypothetical protein